MLISKEAVVNWNKRNKKRLENLGYKFTNFGDGVSVKIKDLSNGSNAIITVKCDYCGDNYTLKYVTYTHRKSKNKDCCGKPQCTGQKAKEIIKNKYGVNNVRELEWVNEKINSTNLEKYGCKNPFGNSKVMEKIKKSNLEKYGVDHISKTDEWKEKFSKKMKQFYILSDVHGFHDEMRLALDNAGFDISNENHVFVSLGDLLDRGPDA